MKDAGAIVGWDIGGAHVKACWMHNGQVLDVAQWACPLWQGLQHLDAALAQAALRWPGIGAAEHAVTMTGEMVDLFPHREAGVSGIAARLVQELDGPLAFYAGARGWCQPSDVAGAWEHIASANWRATAAHVALSAEGAPGMLVDIGSTTTDLIAFRAGQVLGASQTDAQRLATGELVYHGAVRTPLCALAPRVPLRGQVLNVMNEFFATTADVYRLTGELDPAHDLHPAADGAAKDTRATHQRLARMVGLDARDASDAEWLALAQAWRAAQVHEIASQLQRVIALYRLTPDMSVIAAGCGAFLLPDLLATAGLLPGAQLLDYGQHVAPLSPQAAPGTAAWARVCAPCVAVAALFQHDARERG